MSQPRIIELEQWFDSPAGRYILAWQQSQIETMVANVFGYHAIQVGLSGINFLAYSRIRHKARISVQYSQTASSTLVAEPEQLPLESNSVDLLVLPHVLECSGNPHQVLREAERVLMPEGMLVVSGFNPWSLWGARERTPGLVPKLPVPAHYQVSPGRLKDWLKLLSLESGRVYFGCYAPLCTTDKWLNKWSFMEGAGHRWWSVCGSVYMVSAIKRVSGVRLVGPAWKKPKIRSRNRQAVASHSLNSKPKVVVKRD